MVSTPELRTCGSEASQSGNSEYQNYRERGNQVILILHVRTLSWRSNSMSLHGTLLVSYFKFIFYIHIKNDHVAHTEEEIVFFTDYYTKSI